MLIELQESVSVQRSTKVAAAEYNRQGGWVQFDEAAAGETQQHRRSFVERNATWQMMQYCSCPHQTAPTLTAMDQKQLIKGTNDLNIIISPYRENGHDFNHYHNIVTDEGDHGGGESQTLQLFPLRSGGGNDDSIDNTSDKVTDVSITAIDANNLNPCQFFEFIPLKN